MAFPSDIDVFITLVDNIDDYLAAHVNDRNTAVVNIQTALGTNLKNAVMAGEIRFFAGPIADIPDGWLHCDGTTGLDSVADTTLAELYAAIGTKWGGTGADDFDLPDCRDRFPVGANSDDSGVAKSNLEGSLNQTGGSGSQPPQTGSVGQNGLVQSGGNPNIGGHSHTFTPPYMALTCMIRK